MKREMLIEQNALNIASQIINIIDEKSVNSPFIPGYEDMVIDRPALTENIMELYKHQKKNRALIHFLNILAESNSIG